MKNNQFRAYITKRMQKICKDTLLLTTDIDSNTRKCYLYNFLTGDCMGTISLYFTNEYVNIAYSKDSTKVCKVTNQKEAKQFDYCELKKANLFIDKAVAYFIGGFKNDIRKYKI